MFISFEGGEGAGKSTQIQLLAEALKAKGMNPVITREPGGTMLAEKMRELVVKSHGETLDSTAETLLFLAARVQHVQHVIRPALEAGRWVLCDRFSDSTLVYQGIGKGLGIDYVQSLGRMVLGDVTPDRTFLFDIEPSIGLARAKSRANDETRFENLEIAFHHKLRHGFLALAEKQPQRFTVLDASQSIETLQHAILEALPQ